MIHQMRLSVVVVALWDVPYYHAGGKYRMHDLFGVARISRICNAIFYLQYSGTPKYRNMLGKFSPSLCFSANRKLPKVFGAPRIQEYVMQFLLQKVFPRILQVIISNGMVISYKIPSGRKLLPTDSLFFQINSVKTYRYRYRFVIISN